MLCIKTYSAMFCLFCLIGCESRVEMVEIHGEVTYNNKPVQKGIVNFFPADGKGRSAAGIIADGKYAAKVPLGPKQVNIMAFRVTDKRHAEPMNPNSPVVDVEEQILPDCYNVKTTLTCEIKPGVTTQDFSLR